MFLHVEDSRSGPTGRHSPCAWVRRCLSPACLPWLLLSIVIGYAWVGYHTPSELLVRFPLLAQLNATLGPPAFRSQATAPAQTPLPPPPPLSRGIPCWAEPSHLRARSLLPWPPPPNQSLQPARLRDVLHVRAKRSLLARRSTPFGRCAVVGSSKELVHRRLGPRIDEYDVVIRINRLPGRAFAADFGQRTDVFVSNCVIKSKGPGALLDPSDTAGNATAVMRPCSGGGKGRRLAAGGEPCGFKAVIFKPGGPKCNNTHPEWQQGRHGVAEFRNVMKKALRPFEASCSLSTGFLTLLTFMPICKELRVFGFGDPRHPSRRGSSRTADGHGGTMDPHWLAWEHDVLTHLLWPRDATRAAAPGAADAAEWLASHPWYRGARRGLVTWQ